MHLAAELGALGALKLACWAWLPKMLLRFCYLQGRCLELGKEPVGRAEVPQSRAGLPGPWGLRGQAPALPSPATAALPARLRPIFIRVSGHVVLSSLGTDAGIFQTVIYHVDEGFISRLVPTTLGF